MGTILGVSGVVIAHHFSAQQMPFICLAVAAIAFFCLLLRKTILHAREAQLKTEALEKNNALFARINKELEQFAYVASHDLKAPLRHIDNLAQWVIEDTQGTIPPEAEEKLTMLRDRVKRLDTLLNDILSYSRAGRIAGEAEEIDVNELVKSVAEPQLPAGFHLDFVSPMPMLVSPRAPLEQIWGHIFSNAVKHHDGSSGTISVNVRDQGDYYEFTVKDDGPGIPEDFHDRAFEMFQTLQSKDKIEGSGMGLAIIRKLAEYYGGRAWIESDMKARGTTIHFLWPKQLPL